MKVVYDRFVIPDPVPVKDQIARMKAGIEQLAGTDQKYLEAHPDMPALYSSYVQLRATHEERLSDIPTALRLGYADIDTLVAWRCAEIWRQGIKAEPWIVASKCADGGTWYTCKVKLPDGSFEDVQERLMNETSTTRSCFSDEHSIVLLRGCALPRPSQIRRILWKRVKWLTEKIEKITNTEPQSPAATMLSEELAALAVVLELYETMRSGKRD